MKRALITIVAFITLSTLACGLTGSRTGEGEESIAISTPAPAESGDEQPELALDPTPTSHPEEATDDATTTQPPGGLGNEQFEMAVSQLPEGYPEKQIPIYEPASSVVLGGFKQDMDDIRVYNLVIGSDDDVQTVTQSIRNTFENESAEFEQMVGGGMFMGVKDGWEYTIVINSGEADGYGTLVTYVLTAK
jgi:hypothetical protein